MNWETTAFVFPGQGSQIVGMGKDVAEAYPIAKETFQQADDIIGYNLSEICFEGPQETLDDTSKTQPALYVCSIAMLRVLHAELPDIQPRFTAGHSLGEVTALTAAKALSFEDGVKLVQQRGALMKTAGERQPGAMAAVIGSDIDTVHDICQQASQQTEDAVVLANMNCPGQVVISGHETALVAAMDLLKAAGVKRVLRLSVSVAAHSPLMHVVVDEYQQAVTETPFTLPTVPVYANSSAEPMTTVQHIRDELGKQLTHPVNWTDSVSHMIAAGIETFVEIGSKDVLTGLLRRIDRSKTGIALKDLATLRAYIEQNA